MDNVSIGGSRIVLTLSPRGTKGIRILTFSLDYLPIYKFILICETEKGEQSRVCLTQDLAQEALLS